MFNITTVVFDGPSHPFYFTNTSGWNTSSSNRKGSVCKANDINKDGVFLINCIYQKVSYAEKKRTV